MPAKLCSTSATCPAAAADGTVGDLRGAAMCWGNVLREFWRERGGGGKQGR